MLNWFKKKDIDLAEYLNQTKKIVINGVIFNIKRISIEDHLAGLNVILKIRDTYQKEKPKPEKAIEDFKKQKKFMKDIIFAGVVKPQLTMKATEKSKIHVDEILKDISLAEPLTMAIIEFSYGKKK